MNSQEIFDKAVAGVIAQGKRSVEWSTCLYRHPEGLKCAAGFLIPDEDYEKWMEGKGAEHSAMLRYWASKGITQDQAYLIRRLQTIHDSTYATEHFVEEFRAKARALAVELDLNPAVALEPVTA